MFGLVVRFTCFSAETRWKKREKEIDEERALLTAKLERACNERLQAQQATLEDKYSAHLTAAFTEKDEQMRRTLAEVTSKLERMEKAMADDESGRPPCKHKSHSCSIKLHRTFFNCFDRRSNKGAEECNTAFFDQTVALLLNYIMLHDVNPAICFFPFSWLAGVNGNCGAIWFGAASGDGDSLLSLDGCVIHGHQSTTPVGSSANQSSDPQLVHWTTKLHQFIHVRVLQTSNRFFRWFMYFFIRFLGSLHYLLQQSDNQSMSGII